MGSDRNQEHLRAARSIGAIDRAESDPAKAVIVPRSPFTVITLSPSSLPIGSVSQFPAPSDFHHSVPTGRSVGPV